MPPGVVYTVGEPEVFGKFPVRSEIEVLPADPSTECPVCGDVVHSADFVRHCDNMGDPNHLAASVIGS